MKRRNPYHLTENVEADSTTPSDIRSTGVVTEKVLIELERHQLLSPRYRIASYRYERNVLRYLQEIGSNWKYLPSKFLY